MFYRRKLCLKSAMFYMNKFIANRGKDRHVTPAKNNGEREMNVTSLSFEHDLDLEGTVVDNTESSKSHVWCIKRRRGKSHVMVHFVDCVSQFALQIRNQVFYFLQVTEYDLSQPSVFEERFTLLT
eukprot:953517_1